MKSGIYEGLSVEITLYENPDAELPKLQPYKTYSSDKKLAWNVPLKWEGFRDKYLIELMKMYGDKLLVTLCFFTNQGDRFRVFDFDGVDIPRFETVVNGRQGVRFLKKRMCIMDVYEDLRTFRCEGFSLELRYPDPVIKVFECSFLADGADRALVAMLGQIDDFLPKSMGEV